MNNTGIRKKRKIGKKVGKAKDKHKYNNIWVSGKGFSNKLCFTTLNLEPKNLDKICLR